MSKPKSNKKQSKNNSQSTQQQEIKMNAQQTEQNETRELTLKLKPVERKGQKLAIFGFTDGRAGSVQFLRTAFGETVPETVTVTGNFAAPKEKLTVEERRARYKNMTPAEKLAAAEARVARLKEKLAKTEETVNA